MNALSATKRAGAILRHPEQARALGLALALRLEGRDCLVTTAALAHDAAAERCRFLKRPGATLLAVDDERQLGLLEASEDLGLTPLERLAAAPLADGEELVVLGPGASLLFENGKARHLWITRGCLTAGRLHDFVDGQPQQEFAYLLDLAPGLLPPGSAVHRRRDGALAAVLTNREGPAPGLSVAVPIRDALALNETLGLPEPTD
ncbi:MAG: hypothetical protein AAF533_19785 [Acidobacteriota bacterium]